VQPSGLDPALQPRDNGAPAISDVIFIDSRVPDIQDLLNGLKPGEMAFIIDGNSDGLDQIASILQSEHLSNLTGIQIVAHGASGELDLGSTTLADSDLSSHAAALASIGSALAKGGDLSLYACDTGQGATGQQFIADLSQLTGVGVAAATHDIGQTAEGENWTLDAITGVSAAPANAPFTDQALANFQGTLSSAVTGQLWVGAAYGGPPSENYQVYHVDSDGNGETVAHEIPNGGLFYAVGLDTAANLFFALDNNFNFDVFNLTTGALLSTTVIASSADLDVVDDFVVDPVHDVIYMDLFGGDYLDIDPGGTHPHGPDIIKISYNPIPEP